MNIVFIVSDTFRRDNLGCYEDRSVKTPNLDRFAKKSVIFENCYTCSFPTMPARADIFTGKWTYTYLGWAPLQRGETILAQVLQNAKYTTMGVVDTPFFIRNGYNYDSGFSDFVWIRGQGSFDYHDVRLQRRYETDYCAPSTMFTAERWLERHYKEKFFLYVDTWDPHEPWDPPQYYTDLYYPRYDGKMVMPCYWTMRENVNKGVRWGQQVVAETEEDLKIGYACYRGEVTMVDKWVGRLLDSIDSMNLMDDTAIIFTTDHGFYFGEHGQFGKSLINLKEFKFYRSPLYEEVTHIPLLIYVPGVKPRRVNPLVSLPDLMPTVLEMAGVDVPNTFQSQSIVPAIEDKEMPKRDFVVTTHPLCNPGEITREVDTYERVVTEPLASTITTREWTLIYSSRGQPAELYHLPSDPKQEKNVIEEEPQIARELLEKFLSQLEKAGTEPRLINPRRKACKGNPTSGWKTLR